MNVLAAFSALLLLAACGDRRPDGNEVGQLEADEPDNTIVEPRNGALEVRAGQTFSLSLGSNETTGYSWRIAEQPDFVRSAGQRYVGPRPGPDGEVPTGAGGVQILRFVAERAGEGVLTLEYRGPGADEQLASSEKIRIIAR